MTSRVKVRTQQFFRNAQPVASDVMNVVNRTWNGSKQHP